MTREEELNEAWCKYMGKFSTEIMQALAFALRWCDTHPRWISVEDELPKKNIQVLCHGYDRRCKLGKGYIFTSCRVDKANYYRCDGNCFIVNGVPSAFSRVTHWMPLPAPPEKGDKQ